MKLFHIKENEVNTWVAADSWAEAVEMWRREYLDCTGHSGEPDTVSLISGDGDFLMSNDWKKAASELGSEIVALRARVRHITNELECRIEHGGNIKDLGPIVGALRDAERGGE